MEKMLVVVFDNEKKAYEGSRVLEQLDNEGSVTIHGEAVIEKNNDGLVSVKKEADNFPVRTVTGTAIGSLIGLLGGPIGFGVGAAVGTLAGSVDDVYTADVDSEFLLDASSKLSNGKYALVADVNEEWVTPVDSRMEELGGTVFRTTKKNFEIEERNKDIAALELYLDQLKAEQAKAHSDQKTKLQSKINMVSAKIEAKKMRQHERFDEMKKERDAKIQALEYRRKSAHADAKARIDGRINDVRKHFEETDRQFKLHTAERLERTSNKLEDKAASLREKAEIKA